jgi:hypothetical protein
MTAYLDQRNGMKATILRHFVFEHVQKMSSKPNSGPDCHRSTSSLAYVAVPLMASLSGLAMLPHDVSILLTPMFGTALLATQLPNALRICFAIALASSAPQFKPSQAIP